jgi:type IV pilus assembly protein PilY1
MRIRTLALVLSLAPLAALAASDNASWNRQQATLDFYGSPPDRGDNNFFSAVAQKGNVVATYPRRASMLGFPISLYEIRHDSGSALPTGCTNDTLNSATYFMSTGKGGAAAATYQGTYNPAKDYPDPETTYLANYGISDELSGNKAYLYKDWQPSGSKQGKGTAGNPQSPAAACNAVGGGVLSAACQACLTAKGYWLNPAVGDSVNTPQAAVFMGNFLRFYPPKFIQMKLVYKFLVNGPLLVTLRQALITNDTSGKGFDSSNGSYQKYLPSSCNGNGRPLNNINGQPDGLQYTVASDQIAEMLFNIAYMNANTATWATTVPADTAKDPAAVATTFAQPNLANGPDSAGVCAGCNSNFTVLYSDGRDDSANPWCDGGGGVVRPPCQALPQCTTAGMGTANDGNDYLTPAIVGTNGFTDWANGATSTPPGTCKADLADDVARWMYSHDLEAGHAGSNETTFVIGIGSERYTSKIDILDEVAIAGGTGHVYRAKNFEELMDQTNLVFSQIVSRSTSFSVAAITTVQTRGSTFAFIPRFIPAQGNLWAGKLFRFKLFNEFADGCTSADKNTVTSHNPNGDASCNDIFLKDGDGNFIGEDSSGNFIKLDSSQAYQPPPALLPWPAMSAGNASCTVRIPANCGTAGHPACSCEATPVWEADSALKTRVPNMLTTDKRLVWTVYQSNSSSPSYDRAVRFDPTDGAAMATLTPFLKLGGVTGVFCTELSTQTSTVFADEQACATAAVKHLLGQDPQLLNPLNRACTPPGTADVPCSVARSANPAGTRPNVLGDIYHSSPVLVTPPVPTFLCSLGVVGQCVQSLFLPTLTRLQTYGPNDAYTQYQLDRRYRQEVLLVGANDGMLHAFDAGVDAVGDDPETPAVEVNQHYFTLGTGKELWAFVPPDLLPKLKYLVIGQRHEVYVDGTPMVRDIWTDGSGATAKDGVKQKDEFHTVAIVGEREGGRKYFALDITDPDFACTMGAAGCTPVADDDALARKFRWSWPQPGTSEDLYKGESWNDHAPAPPPIGPIAMKNAASGAITVGGVKADEVYIVALGGGFDPDYVRGRSINIVDAWSGTEYWRWSRQDSSGDTRQYLRPIASTPALLDVDADGIFDALVVGDTAGQLWAANLSAPGFSSTGSGRFDNWLAARAFVQFKGQPLWHTSPFFHMPAATLSNNVVRVYLGAGDRSQIRSQNVLTDSSGAVSGSGCDLSNLRGCMRLDCDVHVTQTAYTDDTHSMTAEWEYSSGGSSFSSNTLAVDGNSQSSSTDKPVSIEAEYSLSCSGTAGAGGSTGGSFNESVSCDWGTPECPTASGRPTNTSLVFDPANKNSTENGRFYAVRLFETTGNRAPFTDAAGMSTYDGAALTDKISGSGGGSGELFDASSPPSSNPNQANGWWLKYVNATGLDPITGVSVTHTATNEKTASGALALGGCIIWNSLIPNPTGNNISCGVSGIPTDTAALYHADAITGSAACGAISAPPAGTLRYTTRNAIVPPPMPTPVISVNPKTDQETFSGISLEPGAPPLQITVGSGGIRGTLHWLEVSRSMHNCRHGGAGCPQQ